MAEADDSGGDARVKTFVEDVMDALRAGMREATEDMADFVVQVAKGFVPVGETGNLSRSIMAKEPVEQRDQVSIMVGAYAEYAAAVEYGSATRGEPMGSAPPAGWPTPPPGKRWWAKYPIEDAFGIKGLTVFHPGIEPKPYMRPSIDMLRSTTAWRRIMQKSLYAALDRRFKRIR